MFLRAPFLFLSLAGSYLRPACAFPTLDHLERLTGKEDLSAERASAAFEKLQHDIKGRLEKRFLFDAMTTPVDVNGDHAFQPPADGEQRGPCPGLNALANHGYVSRDGIVSLAEVVSAINEVYGMGVELALVLGIMGVVWTGDPISLDPSFSIGKNDTAVHNALDDLQGILGTLRFPHALALPLLTSSNQAHPRALSAPTISLNRTLRPRATTSMSRATTTP